MSADHTAPQISIVCSQLCHKPEQAGAAIEREVAWTDFIESHHTGIPVVVATVKPDRGLETLPGASFTVNGAMQAHDSALTTASVEMKWINGWSAAATFEGEFSNVTSSYAGKGVVRYTW